MDLTHPLAKAAIYGLADQLRISVPTDELDAPISLPGRRGISYEGLTLLMVAGGSPWSNAETVRVLTDIGANVHRRSAAGVTAAFYAVGGIPAPVLNSSIDKRPTEDWWKSKGDAERLRVLLDRGADEAHSGLLLEASKRGDAHCLRLLLDRGANPMPHRDEEEDATTFENESLKQWLVRKGMEKISRRIAEARSAGFPVVPEHLNTGQHAMDIPLHQAAASGSTECVRLLLEAGVPADLRSHNGANALGSATTVEVAHLLAKHGASVHCPCGSSGDIIDHLFDNGSYDVAHAILQLGAPAESTGKHSRAHRLAGVHMNPKALHVYISNGGDILAPSASGGTTLHTAAWQGDYARGFRSVEGVCETIRMLVSHGVPIHAKDEKGETALHAAVGGDCGSPAAAQTLLELGADPNDANQTGQTPLMLAASRGETDCVKILLDHSADVWLTDTAGKTALEHALDFVELNEGDLVNPNASRPPKRRKMDTNRQAALENLTRGGQCANLIAAAQAN